MTENSKHCDYLIEKHRKNTWAFDNSAQDDISIAWFKLQTERAPTITFLHYFARELLYIYIGLYTYLFSYNPCRLQKQADLLSDALSAD